MTKALSTFLSTTGFWVAGLGLAAFLTLFWVLRGAPVGQAVGAEEDEDAPRGGYRDGVVAAVCVGMLLIVAGAYLAVTRGVPWSLPAFVLGFGAVLTLARTNQRYRHGSPTLRRTLDLSTAALNASLFAGILIVVNVITFRYGGRALDLTRERAFSLSSLTDNQVKTLTTPVTFTTFFGRSKAAVQQFDRVQQLLDLYRAANPEMVRLDHVDPFRDLVRYETLVKAVPDVDVTPGGGIVIEYGAGNTARRAVVRNSDLFDLPRAARFDPNADEFQSVFKGEDAVTTALIRLREGTMPKVVFTTGHGEPSPDDMEMSRPGLGLWKSRLTGTGSEVFTVNLLTQEVAPDVSLVVVVGPKTPFKPDEVARLKAYTDRKGPLLLLLDDAETTGLGDFLKPFQIAVAPGFVAEPRLNFRGRPDQVIVQVRDPAHPILEPLNNMDTFFYRPAPLKVLAPTGAVMTTVLLRSTPQSWAEPDPATRRPERNDKDEHGPFNVGLVVNDRPGKGAVAPGTPRLVIFSSRHLADNPLLQIATPNLDLLMNTVNYLRGRPDLRGVIDPGIHKSLTLTADPLVRARLVLVPTVMAVLLIVTLGVTTYLARRD